MRVILAILVVAAALMLPLPHDDGPPQAVMERSTQVAVEQAVLAANARMVAASNRGDYVSFFDFVLPEARGVVIQDGVVFATRADAEQAVQAGLVGVARVERTLQDPQVTVISARAALLTSPGVVVATLDDGRVIQRRFAVSIIFVRRGEEWKVLHGHYSLPPTTP
jgi:hypothetical protein